MTTNFKQRLGALLVTRLAHGMLALGASVVLASCAVGPAYHRPAPPNVAHYTAASAAAAIPSAPAATGSIAGAQTLESGAAVQPRWWESFGSSALDQLVDRALARNPNLAAAQATLEQAQFNLKAAKGVFYPQVSLGLGGERTRTTGAAAGGNFPPQLYNLYTGQVSVTYYPDVFGLNRLVAHGEQAQVDVARDQLAAARLTIAGNVVNTVLDLAALEDEVTATRKNVSDQGQVLALTRARYQLGATSEFNVFTQESQLASSEAQLPQLQQARDEARHLLATYLGTFPSEAGHLRAPALADLHLPKALPLSLPSTLVRERPDIMAAEAQLRAANAQVGEAVARMYPNLQLSGSFGNQSNHTSSLFDPASQLWNLAANLMLPLFEGGTLEAQKHATEAAYRGVFANYQRTVLDAFRNVADVLRALQHDSTLLDAQARAMRDAEQALVLVQAQYQAGGVDFLSVLTSETQVQNARIAYVRAEAQRYADTAALYVALGGGEWTEPSTPAQDAEVGKH